MNLKTIALRLRALGQSMLGFIQETLFFTRSGAAALQNRRQQTVKDAAEAERIDRIRNPSEYRGK